MKRLSLAALAGILSAAATTAVKACDTMHAYEYQMTNGAYILSLNGVQVGRNNDPSDYLGVALSSSGWSRVKTPSHWK